MRIAALQFCPEPFQPDRNRETIAQWCDTGSWDIAVIPELATTGYFFESQSHLSSMAEPTTGRTCTLLRDLAQTRHMLLIAGFAERDGTRIYNSAAAAFPDGSLKVYRKVHLFGEETLYFTPGDLGFHPFSFRDAKVGIMICYDWRFPEAARTLALRGAEIICHPSDLVASPSVWKPVMRTRAIENKVIIATANRTGAEHRGSDTLTFHGCSQIVRGNGEVASEWGENDVGWIEADIDPATARGKALSQWNDLFADRRPALYEP